MNSLDASLCKARSLYFTLARIGIDCRVFTYLYGGIVLEEMDILLPFET